MRIALPRSVGVASLDELLVVTLTSQSAPADVLSGLSSQMPAGITLLSAATLAEGDRSLPCEARYALDIEKTVSESVERCVARFMSQDCVEVDRIAFKTRSRKTVNIRQYILTMDVGRDYLNWTQSITTTGTARLNEVLEALELPSRRYLHRIRRVKVSYRP